VLAPRKNETLDVTSKKKHLDKIWVKILIFDLAVTEVPYL